MPSTIVGGRSPCHPTRRSDLGVSNVAKGAWNEPALAGFRASWSVGFWRRRLPRRLPVVLSVEEIALLLQAAPGPKYKAAFSTAYGSGLRVSEVVALKVGDIDSERMLLRVEQGKGRKDRDAMLSPQLLELLRDWWVEGRRRGVLLPRGWLFRAATQSSRSRPVSSTAPSTPPPRLPGSRSECRRIRRGTASPRTCWNRIPISASSRCCSAMPSSTPQPVTPASPIPRSAT